MIYVVSGFMRTGTSMMMQTLEAGGMEVVRSDKRDKLNNMYSDDYYKPNPESLYELSSREIQQHGFPKQYKGKVIKLVVPLLRSMSVFCYKVVFMMRNLEEIRQSYEGAFQQRLKVENIENAIEEAIEQLKNRKDVESLTILNYRGVLQDPIRYLDLLFDSGWDFDVIKAASIINKDQCRFRLENLTVGI